MYVVFAHFFLRMKAISCRMFYFDLKLILSYILTDIRVYVINLNRRTKMFAIDMGGGSI